MQNAFTWATAQVDPWGRLRFGRTAADLGTGQAGCLRDGGGDCGGQYLTLFGERSDRGRRGGAVHELLPEFPLESPNVAGKSLRVAREGGCGGAQGRVVTEVDERDEAFHGWAPVSAGRSSGGIASAGVESAAVDVGAAGTYGQVVAAAPAEDCGGVQAELGAEVF